MEASVWKSNLPEAVEAAREHEKGLLIYFSGSSWNESSKAFEREVLEVPGFLAAAQQDFVLVNFDFPKNARKDPASMLKITTADRYAVQGIPTIILADAAGRPFETMAYQSGNAEQFIVSLSQAKEEGQAVLTSLEKEMARKEGRQAAVLEAGLKKMDRKTLVTFYEPELEALEAAAGKEGSVFAAEVRKREELRKEKGAYRQLLLSKKFEEVLRRAGEEAEKRTGEEAQRFQVYRIQALAGKKDFEGAREAIGIMTALAPQSKLGKAGERYRKIIKGMEERENRKSAAKGRKNSNGGESKGERPSAEVEEKSKAKSGGTAAIVSKPLAIVTNPEVLVERAAELRSELKKATQLKVEKEKAIEDLSNKENALKRQQEELAGRRPALMKEIQQATQKAEKIAKKLGVMTEMIKDHEKQLGEKAKIAQPGLPREPAQGQLQGEAENSAKEVEEKKED